MGIVMHNRARANTARARGELNVTRTIFACARKRTKIDKKRRRGRGESIRIIESKVRYEAVARTLVRYASMRSLIARRPSRRSLPSRLIRSDHGARTRLRLRVRPDREVGARARASGVPPARRAVINKSPIVHICTSIPGRLFDRAACVALRCVAAAAAAVAARRTRIYTRLV